MSKSTLLQNIITKLKYLILKIFLGYPVFTIWSCLTRNYIPIFMLHRFQDKNNNVVGHAPEMIDKLLITLKKKGFNFISLYDLTVHLKNNQHIPKNTVVFTMDDGYLEQGIIGAPIFIKHQCPLTIFIIANFIGGVELPWDAQLRNMLLHTEESDIVIKHYGRVFKFKTETDLQKHNTLTQMRRYCKNLADNELSELLEKVKSATKIDGLVTPSEYLNMSWDDCRQLSVKGVDFASHSISHRMISKLDESDAHIEIENSWLKINSEIINSKKLFCYPTGRKNIDFTVRDENLVKKAGYQAAVSADHGYFNIKEAKKHNDILYRMNRISMPDTCYEALVHCLKLELIANVFKFSFIQNILTKLLFIKCHKGMTISTCFRYKFYNLKYKFGGYKTQSNIDFSKVKRLIFLCTGNICRSAFGEWYTKPKFNSVTSYGIEASDGQSANYFAQYVSDSEFSVNLSQHKTKPIAHHKYESGDLILAMEPKHLAYYSDNHIPDGVQTTLLGLWADKRMPAIYDPYHMEEKNFEECFKVIANATDNIIISTRND